jgi:hypothetical protein
MIKFEVINRIPRILFRYKSKSTNQQLVWRYFPLPTRLSTIYKFLKNITFGDPTIYKYELGILLSHDNIYREEDVILAVGLGNGVSLIHNCKKNRNTNSFIGIDGSLEQIEISKANAKLNGVESSKFTLIEGYVGDPYNIYGKKNEQSTKKIDINEFKFDVLELDCEGSEIEILSNLIVRPRHIIVEMHPMYRDIDIDDFLQSMNNKGYKIANIYTTYGDIICLENINKYFEKEKIKQMKKLEMDLGDEILVLNFTKV